MVEQNYTCHFALYSTCKSSKVFLKNIVHIKGIKKFRILESLLKKFSFKRMIFDLNIMSVFASRYKNALISQSSV